MASTTTPSSPQEESPAPHDKDGRLDRSVCAACGDAYFECSKCGVYLCECTRGEPCPG